ncbi:hypothetical protein [Variovorax saccharolyticus]|uniref:hypothetical protein n=1 Tax=Variovorax saccharolyticus TaxID=3053516 RepID=UPI002578B6F4|nr:hypothetical protein [Variovorax sp. J31P216]MDM0029825.1 hypothetical protein [Variovorax sp. J31P216]
MHEIKPTSAHLKDRKGNFELRGFAQLMADGRWAPRASVVEHRDSEGLTIDSVLPLTDAPTFPTENEAANYGMSRAIAFADVPPSVRSAGEDEGPVG